MLRLFSKIFSILAVCFIGLMVAMLLKDAATALIGGDVLLPGYWDYRDQSYQALSMFFGTAVVTSIAIGISFPIGLAGAIYLSEFLAGKRRGAAKIVIELLAGIPSVVYGLIGITFLLPLIGPTIMEWGGLSGDSLLAAGILLAIMILPTMTTFSDDALRCVPWSMREEGLGLGLSQTQVILSIVCPKAFPGIIRAGMLAIGRALGETIAIYLVIGRSDQLFSMDSLTFESLIMTGQTLTTKLGGSELAIAYGDPSHWAALMSLGVLLWVGVGCISFLSERFLRSPP
jgi:phosphate transport system permease protein